jgi:hypothetical protein
MLYILGKYNNQRVNELLQFHAITFIIAGISVSIRNTAAGTFSLVANFTKIVVASKVIII